MVESDDEYQYEEVPIDEIFIGTGKFVHSCHFKHEKCPIFLNIFNKGHIASNIEYNDALCAGWFAISLNVLYCIIYVYQSLLSYN